MDTSEKERMLYRSVGTLHYEILGNSYKLTVEVDKGIALFYRAMIPKYYRVVPQKYPPHISVVRKEIPVNMDMWGKHEGEKVEFFYDPDLQCDHQYWWINVFSVRLEEIRKELGLPVSSPYTLPPTGFDKCFHSTIGNQKHLG